MTLQVQPDGTIALELTRDEFHDIAVCVDTYRLERANQTAMRTGGGSVTNNIFGVIGSLARLYAVIFPDRPQMQGVNNRI